MRQFREHLKLLAVSHSFNLVKGHVESAELQTVIETLNDANLVVRQV